ncbi:MAG TPA: hypothetical protein DDX19_11360 [Rhodopirellula baltica]|nr:hypothetical protein [Rhodopirellula baltica]
MGSSFHSQGLMRCSAQFAISERPEQTNLREDHVDPLTVFQKKSERPTGKRLDDAKRDSLC